MNARPRALILALLVLTGGPALASSRALPELPGRSIGLADEKASKEKKVVDPEDPGIDCVREVTAADKRAALDADFKGSTGNAAKNLTKCLPQADALRRAGEAASYLGHYYTNFSAYSEKLRGMKQDDRLNYHDAIRECVQNGPGCTDKKRQMLLEAIVQYNFGKEIKANVLESNARAERMKTASADLPADYWRAYRTNAQRVMTHKGALKTGSLRTTTFRLKADKSLVFDWDKATAAERAQLGSAFFDQYREFVNTYSQTTQQKSRWHYVPAKSSALLGSSYRAGDDPRNLDQKQGKLAIDRQRHDADMRSQNTQSVNEIIHGYKELLNKDGVQRQVGGPGGKPVDKFVRWDNTDPRDIAADVGVGMPEYKNPLTGAKLEPKEVAGMIVVSINKAIVDTEDNVAKKNALQKARVPAGNARASGPKVIPTVMVDVEKFDKFLDAIWPADVAKP